MKRLLSEHQCRFFAATRKMLVWAVLFSGQHLVAQHFAKRLAPGECVINLPGMYKTMKEFQRQIKINTNTLKYGPVCSNKDGCATLAGAVSPDWWMDFTQRFLDNLKCGEEPKTIRRPKAAK